jgi:outer membrane receptor protein involved in Fe transport
VRVDRWSLTRDAGVSPWLQGELRLTSSFKLRAGGGIYRQFPGFDQAVGSFAAADVQPERAYHADIGVEQTFGDAARWQVTLYNRRERDVLRFVGDEIQVVNGRLVFASPVRWTNSLDGYARGVEMLLQRRSANGLSGWASYSLGFNRYHDRLTGEAFDGDFDQRHTLNVHAAYRLTNRTGLAMKFRYGSNTPAPGYWEERSSGVVFVSSARNQLRIPAYSRLDLRGSRTFNWQSRRLTLFVELLNALGHDNMRFNIPAVNGRTRQAFGIFEEMIPLIPSAGILLEF